MNEEALGRIARRAVAEALNLPPQERIQLFEDIALILPQDGLGQVARDTAFSLREAELQQKTFLDALESRKDEAKPEPSFEGVMLIVGKGRKKFFGIGKEAKRLGVDPSHLWLVLTGKRVSKRLMKRVRIRTESAEPEEALK